MPNSSKLTLITGASGFLGAYLAAACRAAGYSVLGIDTRPPRPDTHWLEFRMQSCETVSWEHFLADREISVVFHLAGSASVPDSVADPDRDFSTSMPGTAKLLGHIARHHASAHVVFFSSAAVYGNPHALPISECAPIAPISPYGIHKAISEVFLDHYTRLYDFRASILRIFSAFGPGLEKQFFWDFAWRALNAADAGAKSIAVHGTGNESRDFIYATDIARAALHLAELPATSGCEVFNVGSGQETTIAQAASMLVSYLELDLDLKFSGVVRPGDPVNWRADVSKLAATGFHPCVSLADGIKQIAPWLKHQLCLRVTA